MTNNCGSQIGQQRWRQCWTRNNPTWDVETRAVYGLRWMTHAQDSGDDGCSSLLRRLGGARAYMHRWQITVPPWTSSLIGRSLVSASGVLTGNGTVLWMRTFGVTTTLLPTTQMWWYSLPLFNWINWLVPSICLPYLNWWPSICLLRYIYISRCLRHYIS